MPADGPSRSARGCETLDGTKPEFHLIAVLTFESREACAAAFASEAGHRCAADVPNYATGGYTFSFYDAEVVV